MLLSKRPAGWLLSLGLAALLAGCITTSSAPAAKAKRPRTATEDSGGVLLKEQAAYDVQHCELDLQIFPKKKSIAGTARIGVRVLKPLEWLVLDLDPRLAVKAVHLTAGDMAAVSARFERRGPRLWINLGSPQSTGTSLVAAIDYGGVPQEALRAPWDGGFTWSKTKGGQSWIATTCETEGADLWWPCKDHSSDKPESFTLRIRVPEPLVVASNGKLIEVVPHGDGTRTYHWHTDFPISNYNIALNIGPYETITAPYHSVGGQDIPVTYWVLPENRAAGEKLFP